MDGRIQVLISSKLQEMEIAHWVKSMEFDSNEKKIVVTLENVDGVKEVRQRGAVLRNRAKSAAGRSRSP